MKPTMQATPKSVKAQALALGSYRHDVAYTGALKSGQALPLGSYRHDVAYTAALKSSQQHALGSYRHDVAYTAALKSDCFTGVTTQQGGISFQGFKTDFANTGAKRCLAPVVFESETFGHPHQGAAA